MQRCDAAVGRSESRRQGRDGGSDAIEHDEAVQLVSVGPRARSIAGSALWLTRRGAGASAWAPSGSLMCGEFDAEQTQASEARRGRGD